MLILLAVLLAYPVLGSAFLSSGVPERLIASEDLKIELRKPAWTLWPGHFHVPGVRILSNGTTQFKLEASNILVQLELFPLIHRHLHVTSLVADGVRYWMRVQVRSSKGAEKRLAAYPVLDDLPGNPSLFEEKEQEQKGGGGDKKQPDFTVEVDGIDVKVEELWFMEYHYLGKGTLQGSFLVGPHRMRVGTSVQNLGPGELRFGPTTPLLRQFRGRIQAGIPDVNPEEHADSSFLPLVTTDTELHGDLVTLEPLSAYTGKMRLVDGAGSLDTHLKLTKGNLAESSYFRYTTKKAGIRGEGVGLDTDWDLDARIASENGEVLPRIRSTAKATYVSASNAEHRIFTVQVLGHEENVVLQTTQLGRITDVQHARIHLPHVFTKDLHDLAALTSGGGIDSKSGEARASLNLDIDAHHVARGAFDASFDGVHLTASGVDVAAEGQMQAKIDANLDKKAASLRDLTWTVKNVDVRAADRDEKGWWTTANVPYVGASMGGKIEARFSVRSRNAAPLLDVLVEKDQLPGVVRSLTTLPDLRIRGELRKERDVMDVLLEPVENELFDVAGRYFAKGDRSELAIVVGGKAVSLGIAKKTGSGTTLKPFAREGWLNEQLKSFPPPGRRFIVPEP